MTSDRNEPLSFVLPKRDPRHPLLNELGIAATTLEAFGVGYSNAGLLKGLLAIAVRDVTGMFVAYVGLAFDN